MARPAENDQDAVMSAPFARLSVEDEANDAARKAVGAPQGLTSKVLLSIKIEGLVNMDQDNGSLSDPVVVAFIQNGSNAFWEEVGRTEIIANNLNPEFVTQIAVEYQFEVHQTIKFEVYDVDTPFMSAKSSKLILSQQDEQGMAIAPLGLIVGSRTWSAPLVRMQGSPVDSEYLGTITVTAQEVIGSNVQVSMKLAARGLPTVSRGPFRSGPGSAFLRISTVNNSGEVVRCCRTEVAAKSRSPSWAKFSTSLATLAAGDQNRPLQMEVFYYNESGDHTPVCSAQLSVQDCIALSRRGVGVLPLQPHNKSAKAGCAGELLIESCTAVLQPTFVDFLSSGMEIQISCAIDFSGSNGPFDEPTSLHYRDPSGVQINAYETAAAAVGSIVECYDDDKMLPLYGFAGKPSEGARTSHCFPLNGNADHPEVAGVAGILSAYQSSLRTVKLSGPTKFAPVIEHAAAAATRLMTKDPTQQTYSVLLMLTDGKPRDFPETVDAVVAASHLPLSIIIVGVGNADFTRMDILDGDNVRLKNAAGVEASRDIVQFVPMRDFQHQSPYELAKAVLAEIPKQVLEYMAAQNILPANARLSHTPAVTGTGTASAPMY